MNAIAEMDLVAATNRFVKHWRIYSAWKAIEAEFEQEKHFFRNIAGDFTRQFPTDDPSLVVMVEQRPDAVCRVVSADDLQGVVKLSAGYVFDLFTLHPSKGNERNFELNVLKLLPKAAATKLIGILKRSSTAIVRLLAR